MAGHKPRTVARMMMTPSVVLLMLWMIVPLGMTLYFSFLRYNLLRPPASFWGWKNYSYFLTDTAFIPAVINTLLLVLGVVVISVIGGILLAIVLNKDIWGRGYRSPDGYCSVFHHADGIRAGLEEYVYEPR